MNLVANRRFLECHCVHVVICLSCSGLYVFSHYKHLAYESFSFVGFVTAGLKNLIVKGSDKLYWNQFCLLGMYLSSSLPFFFF